MRNITVDADYKAGYGLDIKDHIKDLEPILLLSAKEKGLKIGAKFTIDYENNKNIYEITADNDLFVSIGTEPLTGCIASIMILFHVSNGYSASVFDLKKGWHFKICA